jgi:hypothetical protein
LNGCRIVIAAITNGAFKLGSEREFGKRQAYTSTVA